MVEAVEPIERRSRGEELARLAAIETDMKSMQATLIESDKYRAVYQDRVKRLDSDVKSLSETSKNTSKTVTKIELILEQQDKEAKVSRKHTHNKITELGETVKENNTQIIAVITSAKTINRIWWGVVTITGLVATIASVVIAANPT